ncbi:Z-ring formation inhibitor MciZ [uncultured Metabacillus sp.]|nr:Z-ring formation inhibitor MciZ [uncultured Metabacillus sp.]
MKIYRLDNRIVLVGKAWEIRTKLKEYRESYTTVVEWMKDEKLFTESKRR